MTLLASKVESANGVDQMGIVVDKDGQKMDVMDPLEDQIIIHVLKNQVFTYFL